VAARRRVGLGPARGDRLSGDSGSAVVEFVFFAVVVLLPLLYLLVAVSVVQRAQLAVSQAAREAGRAFATSDSAGAARLRVAAAVRLSLAAHGLPDDASVTFVSAAASCDGPQLQPVLRPGAAFTVCVRRRTEVPGVPRVLAGRGIESVGRYTVHVDEFRTVAP
jgi:Flp pilus assembly protein TadG